MKTIFDQTTREELKNRIGALNESSVALWGKMTVSQMIRHNSQWDEMALGKTRYKQSLMGKLFGKMALKNILKDGPVKKNMPTVPSFKITHDPDFAAGKKKWLELIDEYANFSNDGFIHPFFGKMNKEDIGRLVYKHADHHLQQFNV
jgi:hypothetical protein